MVAPSTPSSPRGIAIAEGDPVVLLYKPANRNESVFGRLPLALAG